MGLGIFDVVWCVKLAHAKFSYPFEWWGGWAVLQIFLCVLTFSLFSQQISWKVVFFFLAAFQASGLCNLFCIPFLLLLPLLSFGLLGDNVIASELLPPTRLGSLPPSGLFEISLFQNSARVVSSTPSCFILRSLQIVLEAFFVI